MTVAIPAYRAITAYCSLQAAEVHLLIALGWVRIDTDKWRAPEGWNTKRDAHLSADGVEYTYTQGHAINSVKQRLGSWPKQVSLNARIIAVVKEFAP